jgi:hypothetical protein
LWIFRNTIPKCGVDCLLAHEGLPAHQCRQGTEVQLCIVHLTLQGRPEGHRDDFNLSILTVVLEWLFI